MKFIQTLIQLTEIRGNFDLSDPDRAPGAVDREIDARASLAKKNESAKDKWDELATILGATKVRNRLDRDSSYIGMTITGAIHIDMFRSDVVIHHKSMDKSHISSIKRIFKKNGVDLYDTDFSTYGSDRRPNSFNGFRIGYYSSITDPGLKQAIIQVVDYLSDNL